MPLFSANKNWTQTSNPLTSEEIIRTPDATVTKYQLPIDTAIYDTLFDNLKALSSWKKEGSRKTIFFGTVNYSYSNYHHSPKAFPTFVLPFINIVNDTFFPTNFNAINTVLVNKYDDALSALSWHADDETELGIHPSIASLSFGAPRQLAFEKNLLPSYMRLQPYFMAIGF